jgi:putative cell wall-binding protein
VSKTGRKQMIRIGLMSVLLLASMATTTFAEEDHTTRLSGKNRMETSVKIAEELTKSKEAQKVILTSAQNFPDSLGGAILSGKYEAPILLVGKNYQDSQEAFKYIQSKLNKNSTIYLLGGEGAVSPSILQELKKRGYENVKRISGQTRYETNANIIKEVNVAQGTPFIVATGENFPDALSMSSISAIKEYPILLTSKNSIKSEALQLLKEKQPSTIYIAGGEGVIPSSIVQQIKQVSPHSAIKRLGGATRYETSAIIADEFKSQLSTQVVVATGKNFPDALSGSSVASQKQAPILLVNDTVSAYKKYFEQNAVHGAYLLGGEAVVSEKVKKEINQLINSYQEESVIDFHVQGANVTGDVTTVYIQISDMSQKDLKQFSEELAQMIRNSNEDSIPVLVLDFNYGSTVYTY